MGAHREDLPTPGKAGHVRVCTHTHFGCGMHKVTGRRKCDWGYIHITLNSDGSLREQVN